MRGPPYWKIFSSRDSNRSQLIRNGMAIIGRIYAKDPYYGARSGVLIGPQGAGKTTALETMAAVFLKKGFVTVWRESELAQFHRFEKAGFNVKVFAHALDDIRIFLLKANSKAEEYNIPIAHYESAKDLISQFDTHAINIVIEPSYFVPSREFLEVLISDAGLTYRAITQTPTLQGSLFWSELFYVLVTRKNKLWYALLQDEADDIYVANPSGITWFIMDWLTNRIKHSRKSLISLYMATQAYSSLHWKIASKLQDVFLFKGAVVPKRCHNVSHSLISQLQRGCAAVDSEGTVGIVCFDPLPRTSSSLLIKKEWLGERIRLVELIQEYGLV